MQTTWQRFSLLGVLGAWGIFWWGCGSGELPTAVEPPQELYAPFIKLDRDIPVLDGRGDDHAWKIAPVYRVFINNTNGGVNLPPAGMLVNMQAVWWKVMVDTVHVSPTRIDTTFASHIGFHFSWPDADKNLDRRMWTYDPVASRWSAGVPVSDWLLLFWASNTANIDMWYWDAATTNPMGYFEDMVQEGFDTGKTIVPLFVRLDGLNFFNDTPTNRNTWDLNLNDNNTSRVAEDDQPRLAWKNDPQTTAPSLPPVYSTEDERQHFLLESDAVLLANSAYAAPDRAVTVPGFALQEPSGGVADVRAFGRHENGRWTLEFTRIAKTADESDVVLNPNTRYFTQVFAVGVGNNAASPFDGEITSFKLDNAVKLTFEFRR